MRTLIMMIGVPASGKTTFANKISDDYLIPLVSSDAVRKDLYGDESIQGDNEKVFEKVYERINHWIDCGACILDATNCTQRSRWAAIAKVCPDQTVYIIMDNDVKKAKENNLKRDRKVPEHVIDRMAKNLKREYPKLNEARNLRVFTYDNPRLLEFLKGL